MIENPIVIEIGSSFRMNAGIVGLVNYLEYAKENGYAIEGIDYEINKYDIYLAEDFILNIEHEKIFFNLTIQTFKNDSKLMNILGKKKIIDEIFEKDSFTIEDEKEIVKIFNEFINKIGSRSMTAGLIIANPECLNIASTNSAGETEVVNNEEKSQGKKDKKKKNKEKIFEIQELKNEKDLYKKKKKYDQIYDIITQEEVLDMLLFKEVCYSKINNFYGDIAFMYRGFSKRNPMDMYRKYFLDKFRDEIKRKRKDREKEKKQRIEKTNKSIATISDKTKCIECYKEIEVKNNIVDITMLRGTASDINRKKSNYWNGIVDDYLCPACAFTQSMIIFGFTYLGRDAVFINSNESLQTMIRVMNSYKIKNQEEINKASFKKRIYGIFVDEKLKMNEIKIHNIEVITKNLFDDANFDICTIPKDMIEKIKKMHNELVFIEKKIIKIKNKSGSEEKIYYVYDKVFDNIVNRRSQTTLINELLKYEIIENGDAGYIDNIIDIELEFQGGENMKTLKELKYEARDAGKKLRGTIMYSTDVRKIDEYLKRDYFNLFNALTTGNSTRFVDLIMKLAIIHEANIPDIVMNFNDGEKEFRILGQSFICGLMNRDAKNKKTKV